MQNFLADYTAPTPAKTIPHPLPEGIDGVRRMLNRCKNAEERALVALTGLMGLRISEARSVSGADFDASNMLMTIRGKGDKTRVIPVSEEALMVLLPRFGQTLMGQVVALSDTGARRALTRLAKEAGLKRHVSSHDMRATFATAAYDATLDIRAVQELMGHSSSATTEIYTGVKMDTLRRAVSSM